MAQTHPATPELNRSFDLDTLIDRVTGIVTFHRATVTSIAADRRALIEAGIVVALVGLATGIGHRADVTMAIDAALIGWVGLTAAIWYIADRFMSTPTSGDDLQALLRTVSYAMAPGVLGITHFIWGLGLLVSGVGTLWSFAVTAFAVRHTTHYGWPRAGVDDRRRHCGQCDRLRALGHHRP